MKIFLTILFGFGSGIMGGMGMGGGTFLIPLLLFLGYEQKLIQGANLISFLPMAIVALIFHFKNKLVKTDGILWIIIPAVLFSIAGAMLADVVSIDFLKICMGIFFLVIGIVEIIKGIKNFKNDKK